MAKGELFTYQPSGAGANRRNVQDKLRERVTAEDFGARGDGITDDTTAWTNAFAYLTSIGGGDIFTTPGKVYGVRNLEKPAKVHLYGQGDNSRFRFLPSGNDATDASSWTISDVGSYGSINNIVIDGQYTAGSSSRRVGNGLRLVADANGLKRSIRGVRITGFSGYKASASGGSYGVSRNFARADITDDAGAHLLTGGNGIKVDTSNGLAAWELEVDGLHVDTLDGIGCDWSTITDSFFSNVTVGNCVFRGWIEQGANNHRNNIKVYRCMMLNCRDDFETSLDTIIPHQATVSADNGGAVLLAGQRLIGSMEAQENGAHGFCLGTDTKSLQHHDLTLLADGNGGIDADADATTNDNYRRYGIFARAYYGGRINGVCDDFRARYGYPRQLRGLHVVSSAGRYQVTTTGSVVAAMQYRIKANSGGADFTPMQIGIASPSNTVGTVFAARQVYGAAFPPVGTTFGSGGVLEPANDAMQANLIVVNQYEQDQGTGPGYSITGDNGKSVFTFNGAQIVNSLTVAPSASTDNAIQVAVKGEAASRLAIQGAKINHGDGTTTPTAAIDYLSANLIGTPTGVSFRAGNGVYNAGHLLMGSYHFWTDATGDLYIKSSAPSTETDGTVVGTQS